MRQSVRAIIIKDDALLVMHRNKFGHQYRTLIGGGVEQDENLETALMREVHEETGVKIADPRLVFIEHAPEPFGDQYVFLCRYVEGEPFLDKHSEEAFLNLTTDNQYEPLWVPFKNMNDYPFRSEELKEQLLRAMRDGWPELPTEFSW